jgi:hypothetical protein
MAGGGLVHALGEHRLGEQTEFDLLVAYHAGVWGSALAIRICEIGNDSFSEFLLHLHQMQGDAKIISDFLYLADLLIKAGQGELHEKTMHGKILFKQNCSGNSGVDTAAHGNADSAGASFFSHKYCKDKIKV